jgi:hypothetical protein
MSEEDFVLAWLLSAKAGQGATVMSPQMVSHLIDEAKVTYRFIQLECNNEADSRTTD